MVVTFRTDVEIAFNIAAIQHVLATRTAHPQSLGHFLSGLKREAIPFGLKFKFKVADTLVLKKIRKISPKTNSKLDGWSAIDLSKRKGTMPSSRSFFCS